MQAWTATILANNLRDLHKKFLLAKKRNIVRERSLADGESRELLDKAARTSGCSPSGEATKREAAERFKSALERLSADHRTIIRLRDFEQLAYTEIATAMDRSVRAVRMLHIRALGSLAAHYKNPSDGS